MSIESPAKSTAPASLAPKNENRQARLTEAARELEATFLYEMLKSAGVGKARDDFGGGAGEDQFTHFLLQQHAQHISEAGGIGLAQSIYQNLLEKS